MKRKSKIAALTLLMVACLAMTAAVITNSEDSEAANTTWTVDQNNQNVSIPHGNLLIIKERYDGGSMMAPNWTYYVRDSQGLTLVTGGNQGFRTWETSTVLNAGVYKFPMRASSTHGSSIDFDLTLTVIATITFNYGMGSGDTQSKDSGGTPIILPTASKQGAMFDGWYTSSSGSTKVGGSGASWTPTGSMTLYARYVDNSVQFIVAGESTTGFYYSVPHNGYVNLQFQVNPINATVIIETNPTGKTFEVINTNGNVSIRGSITNVLPGTYYLTIKGSAANFTDCKATVQLNVATAIIEPLTDQIYVGTTWFYQITTIPTAATINWTASTVQNSSGQTMSPGVDFTLSQGLKSLHFQPLKEGTFYIDLVVGAPGYSEATKRIILNAIPLSSISGPPNAAGITATLNTQVDGGWYFTINQPQNYHYLVWDFGDGGPQASEINVTHQYSRNGTFTVTCTLYNLTSGMNYVVTIEVTVVLDQQIRSDAWVDTPYSYSISAPGTDAVTITTDKNQGWLFVKTIEKDNVRYAVVYSDTGPFASLLAEDPQYTLEVTVWNGASMITTYSIRVWPKISESEISQSQYAISVSVNGFTATVTHAGSTNASYSSITWGDGFSGRFAMDETKTHTYASAGAYTIWVDYQANGRAIARATSIAWVPSNGVEYNVYYDANGGTGSMPSSSGQQIAVANNTFVREGHTFMWWNTSPTGNGTVFVPGSQINSLNADITLYAIWSGVGSGDGSGGGNILNKLKEKYIGIPLWMWIIILILILIVIIAIVKELLD